MKSTDDGRVSVSGIRHSYRELDDREWDLVREVKDQGQRLWDIAEEEQRRAGRPGQARSFALAKTKIEEAVMWLAHGITAPEEEDGNGNG